MEVVKEEEEKVEETVKEKSGWNLIPQHQKPVGFIVWVEVNTLHHL